MVVARTEYFNKIRGSNTYILADSLDDRKRLTIQVKIYTPVFKRAIGMALERAGLWEKLRDPQAEFRIMDLGCGEGLYFPVLHQYLQEQGAKAKITMVGVDRDALAIATAQDYMDLMGLHNVQLYVHDLTRPFSEMEGLNLTRPSNHFDLVYSIVSIMHLATIPQTLAEIFGIIKPGGVYYSKDMPLSHDYQYRSPTFEHLTAITGQIMTKMLPVDFGSRHIELIESAGFEVFESFEDNYPVGGYSETGRRMLENFLLGQHTMRSVITRFGLLGVDEFDQFMQQEFQEISPELEGNLTLVNTIARRPAL